VTGRPASIVARVQPTRTGGRVQERGHRTRAAIVEETVLCVLEEGFVAASAKHIAERAGVTWGVIQYHFGDRNGLLADVVAYGYENFRVAIGAVSGAESDSRLRVASVVDAAWTAFSAPESRASLEILIATRSSRGPKQTTELEEMARDMRSLGAVLVGGSKEAQSLGRTIGEVMWAALRGLVFAQMITREPIESTDERAILIDLIQSYLEHGPIGDQQEDD
jgi:AcrR family transcriptional regulator